MIIPLMLLVLVYIIFDIIGQAVWGAGD